MSKNKTELTREEINSSVVADRLKLAADSIRASRKVPDTVICDAIGDSAWFQEYMRICMNSPISNAFLGCILFGWQLSEEYKNIKEATGIIYRA